MCLKWRMKQREGGGTSLMSTGRKLHVHNAHGSDHPRWSESFLGTESWSWGEARPATQSPAQEGAKAVGNFLISVQCHAYLHSQFSSLKYNPNGMWFVLWPLWPSVSLLIDLEGFDESG